MIPKVYWDISGNKYVCHKVNFSRIVLLSDRFTMQILGCLKKRKEKELNNCFYRLFWFGTWSFTAVLIDWLQVMLMRTMCFCWITRGQIKYRKCCMEDRHRELWWGGEREREEGRDQGSKDDKEWETAWKTKWWGWETILLCSVLDFVYSRSPHIWHVPCSILRFTKFSLSFPLTARTRESLRGGHTRRQQHIEMGEIAKKNTDMRLLS